MSERFPRGSIARIFFDIVSSGVGLSGQNPTLAIRREDGRWFQASDGTWVSSIVNNPMLEKDTVNEPGRYYFDFDQSKDAAAEGNPEYTAKLANAGAATRLEYQRLFFGPIPSVNSPGLCSIMGTLFTMQGDPVENAVIRATLIPVYSTGQGLAIQNTVVIMTHSDGLGDFDLPVVRGATIRLEIPDVGYDRKVTVPTGVSSVLFTEL
jgi:hypothetical protein